MTESEFIDLLSRFERGQCTTEEKELLEKWLDSPGKGKVPFINETKRIQVKNALHESVLRKTGQSYKSIAFLGPGAALGKGWLREAYRIAASILLVAIVGYGVLSLYNKIAEEKYAATAVSSGSTIQKVILSDGSIVWLKPNSSLTYPKIFRDEGERVLTLNGEAFFEVEKNPRQPFVVKVGQLTTTVLGTSFNIKTTREQIEVIVLTGKVSVSSALNEQIVIVLPDERAIYHEDSKLLAKAPRPVEPPVAEAIVTGTEYDMNFNNTRMSEIIRRIEGKFNVKTRVSDASLGNCVITADFTGQSLTKTLDIITTALSLEYEIEDGNIVTLEGRGCR